MIAVFFILLSAVVAGADDSLSFQISGKETARLTGKDLEASIKPQTIRFFDPRYEKTKSYRCFPIKEVMARAFGPGWRQAPQTEAVLAALDGYASISRAAKLDEDGGCLAFEDAEFPGWEPVGRKRANPGPFYLVWVKPEQSTENEYPWPYQLASINLVKFEERYPEVVPKGAAEDSPAFRGYGIFRGQCLRCHSINRQGGKIGPDLNAPQSITAYRPKKMIKEFIRRPSKFRYTEMPDHSHLTDQDLDDLYAYFKHKAKEPEKAW